jgi:folate-binding Fe-S cluster repair protein YgfZ
MKAALLPDRGVVKVTGDGARSFLNGLFTADIGKMTPDAPRFAALLTPQGKIILDAIVVEAEPSDGGGFFLDVPRALAKTCVDRLDFYKLRAKVIVEDLSEMLGVGRRSNDRIRLVLSRSAPSRPRSAGDAAAQPCRGSGQGPRRHAGRGR